MTECAKCQKDIDPLAIFPGNICLDCYSKTEEANREITAEELAQMWGGNGA